MLIISWFDSTFSGLKLSTVESLNLSTIPNELEETLIILNPSLISVEENALLVKHVLFITKGDILSGISTTLETYEASVIPDKWAPKNFELADEDNITTEEFSDFITSANDVYYHQIKASRGNFITNKKIYGN